MRRLCLHLSSLLAVGLLIAGCSASNPAGPSSTAGPGGATITGTLQGVTAPASSGLPRQIAAASSGTTVVVVGTNVSGDVDSGGKFTLAGVPDGTQQLRFKGPGVDGTVTVTNVARGESIDLTIVISAAVPAIDVERRSSESGTDLEGRVESIPVSPAGSFVVAGRRVLTNASTAFTMNGGPATFASLAVGQRVHVKGSNVGSDLLASSVSIQNTDTELPVNVNGVVEGFTGTSAAFAFKVEGRDVHGDAATEFFGGSTFADLRNGARVEVKGSPREGFVYAVRIHVNRDETTLSDEFSGTLTSITGTPPVLTLVIGGRTVVTNAATEVRRRGDNFTLAVLQVGMSLEVSGATSGGIFTARKLTIESSAFDVDVDGVVTGAVAGTCPVISFKIGALTLKGTAFTEFKKISCAAIATGVGLKARGVLLPGATSAEAALLEPNK